MARRHTNGIASTDATTFLGSAEHQQQHPRWLWCFDGVRNPTWHVDNRSWRSADARTTDGQVKSSFENDHERIEWRRVFGEFLSGIKCKQRQVAARSTGKNAAGDAAGWRRDERVERKRLGWRHRGDL